ncbi:hypothetical protein PISMIDRAFT_670131 [Pisolithus microcarpus 441]|uniref:Uncharacterized protein n=1 Tax=Pisolithus microcarpus 441 TaxID=765257 RepID=A0A0D0AGE8_9AGAM|nr:hypothetical protein PISMIDRAFT_670131 [Pisolithus microcarpus 441]
MYCSWKIRYYTFFTDATLYFHGCPVTNGVDPLQEVCDVLQGVSEWELCRVVL